MPNPSIIITGASVGIGAATATALAKRGHPLILSARRSEELEAVAADVRKAGGQATTVIGDICDPVTRAAIVREGLANGGIYGLVNNAGFGQAGPVELVGEAAAKRQFEVNIFALMELTRLALPHMRAHKTGRIVNVSSVLGRVSRPMYGWYCASKFALEALSDALREEVYPFGIRVSIVQPGPIETEFGQAAGVAMDNLEAAAKPAYAAHLAGMARRGERRHKGVAPARVASAIVHALFVRRPRVVYRVTATTRVVQTLAWLLPRGWVGAIAARETGLPRKML